MNNRKRKKTGILGGTFNPVHIGHLLLAEWVREAAELDEILFIPTGYSYMKMESSMECLSSMPDGWERLRMIELAVAGRQDFCCSDIEVRREGYTYTFETLELLRKETPDTDYYFIMGADCLFTIENWRYPERIFRSATLIAAARSGMPVAEMEAKSRELEERYQGKILLFPFLSLEVSSTDIRKRIKEGKSIRYQVPDQVLSYITEKQLYI